MTPAQEHAQRAWQASTNLQQAMVIARTALAARTGPLQQEPLRHRARHVPRTRPRLLRAVLVPPALATRATVATPGQGIAWKSAETVSRPLQKDAMTETRQRATAAAQGAQSSVDTTALLHNPTSVAQHAETPSALATRHATTATPSVGMDAVRIAQMLSPDGLVQLSRAAGLIARRCVETASRPFQKDAMTATRQRATAAAQGASSSADTTALLHSPTSAAQHAETPSALTTRHATTATPSVGMDAVRIAQMLSPDYFTVISLNKLPPICMPE